MSNPEVADDYVLPASLIGHADLGRLLREVEAVDSALQAQKVRGESSNANAPEVGRTLSDFVEQNDIDLKDGHALMELKERLRKLKDHAPVVHMAFASEVDEYTLQQIVTWLRTEAHPYTLLTVGLQPSLIGGVYMRTPNQVHDFSVKALLKDKRHILVEKLEALRA